ncbi:DNA/RNA non-specific endonuclease [Sphingobium phenoxybenzoativorans]|uniref:DNA/RNA non-specific endonuclease n=1 Tax=Sphingobium phenoxybenzoativorans TaxID=1592790 RepID=UPI000872CAC5|nr:DNA/RNA non-specific endonuclease [Sphingobium phenoxybenzoativorans]
MQDQGSGRRTSPTAFSIYLRTGRRVDASHIEVKYNPWHDEENGRFTFAGQGKYFPAGSSAKVNVDGKVTRSDWARPDKDWVPDRSHLRADHPKNHSIYVVRPGDSLVRIARQRRGLTAYDLSWLNKHPINRPLVIGQRIKLPHQSYLDAGRTARAKFLALSNYMDTHGGKLPPDPANPPSLQSQILDSNWRKETKNGYDFHIDAIVRPRKIFGQLSMGPMAARSRRNQAQAGHPDRRRSDDGGHFIAARFNGPSDSFNHFAQDANFNRGAYRSMEDVWAKALREGQKVSVAIEPHYKGASRRPYEIAITWSIDGKEKNRNFPNEAKEPKSGR